MRLWISKQCNQMKQMQPSRRMSDFDYRYHLEASESAKCRASLQPTRFLVTKLADVREWVSLVHLDF
jgi:hypothetical protein